MKQSHTQSQHETKLWGYFRLERDVYLSEWNDENVVQGLILSFGNSFDCCHLEAC